MLPFMKKRPSAGVIVSTRPADETKQAESESYDSDLELCAQDLINAVHNKDKKAVAEALRAAHEVCDTEPHAEGEHTNGGEE